MKSYAFRAIFAFALLSQVILATGCASKGIDKCYISPGQYERIRALFLDTGSFQRVEQLMEQEDWANCERDQIRFQIAKDFNLDDLYVELEN